MEKKYNLSAIPFLICFVFFCYIFVALFNTGYYFATPIIVVSSCTLIFWLSFLVYIDIKNKLKFSKFQLLVFITGILLGFWYVNKCWFGGYLNLHPLNLLFEKKVHYDTSYHSAFAKNFVNYGLKGYFDGNIKHYHIISHYLISKLAKITLIPSYFFYNYLFHIIFLPIYIFLLQKVLFSFREYLGLKKSFSFSDFIFFIVFLLGFNLFNVADNASCWYNSIIDSESCIISMIIMLLAFELFFKYYKSFIFKNQICRCFIICLFILLLSGSKISTGIIFYILCCYIIFRNAPLKFSTWCNIFIFSLSLVFSYFLFSRTGELSRSFTSEKSSFISKIFDNFLAFPREYIRKDFWIVHYLFYSIPFIIIYKFHVKEKIFSKEYFNNFSNMYFEIPFILTIISFLPGLFMDIVGGSALYFVLPVYVISVLILWGLNYPDILLKDKRRKKFIIILLSVSLFYPSFIQSNIKESITYVFSRGNHLRESTGIYMKIKHLFDAPKIISMENYKIINSIYYLTKDNINDWCITIEDDSVVDEYIMTKAIDVLFIPKDNSINTAKELGKKRLIVVKQNSYDIIDL